jgi:hypothetical protein
MSWFQLDPQSIAGRTRAGSEVPSLSTSLRRGMVGFTLVALAGFAPWALFGRWFYRTGGEVWLYVVCALVFIALSGVLLHRLIIGAGSLPRFYKLFGIGFAAYSVGWILGWMFLRGDIGSLVGLLAGTTAMGLIMASAFGATGNAVKIIAALFTLNSLGYFAGQWMTEIAGTVRDSSIGAMVSRPVLTSIARLIWGLCYGAGFGAGLGLAFYYCQTAARRILASREGIIVESQ